MSGYKRGALHHLSPELRICERVEIDVLGFPSLTVRTVSAEINSDDDEEK